MKKKKTETKVVYELWLDLDTCVLAFVYPPIDKVYNPEPGEIQLALNCWAKIGHGIPYRWPNYESPKYVEAQIPGSYVVKTEIPL